MNTEIQKTAVSLPTKKLALLLDNVGIEMAWKSLLATHVSLSRPEFVTTVLGSDEFAEAEILKEDLLEGLSIGQKSLLYEFSLAHVDKISRKKSGQYFTPDDVAIFLAEKSKTFPTGVWLDPCSGVGNLSHWLAKGQEDPEDFVINRLRLIDRDALALLIARTFLALDFQEKEGNLFAKLKSNCVVADFLETQDLPSYDYAILNPPYATAKEDKRFKTHKARDTYSYFVEKIMDTSKGFISITPQSFTHSMKLTAFRDLLISNYDNFDIYCFDNMPDAVFRAVKFGATNTNTKNSTRAGVIVAQKGSGNGTRITPLLKWTVPQRTRMFAEAPLHLGPFTPQQGIFPKVGDKLSSLYQDVSGLGQLKNLLSSIPTDYALTIPTSPRYFAPAVKRPLSRTSFTKIYFPNEDILNRAYVYLNGSIFYWWWRISDDGMMITNRSIYSLPVPAEIPLLPSLVEELEKSETDNLVVKANAGKFSENVKHDLGLVGKINKYFYPDYANGLIATHKNTVL